MSVSSVSLSVSVSLDPFDSILCSKFFENTSVFEIMLVLFKVSCLVAPNKCDFSTAVLGKL